jgi:predicted component of type VI protein secretion system
MKLSLVVLSAGKAAGQIIPVTLSQFLIGRDRQCHLRPISPLISKRHCAVIVKNNKAFIRDFDSTNGTLVNDQAIQGEHELADGDMVKVGPLEFRIALERQTPVNAPTPLPGRALNGLEDDESIAALLLEEDGSTSSIGHEVSEGEIPSGTTEMDIPMPVDDAQPDAAAQKKSDTKAPKSKGNTSNAAAELLAQYQRRPRAK